MNNDSPSLDSTSIPADSTSEAVVDEKLLGTDKILSDSVIEFPDSGVEIEFETSEEETSYYSVLTAEGMLKSFSNVTGVPFEYEVEGDSGLERVLNTKFFDINHIGQIGYYGDVSGNLPKSNNLSKFNSSNLNSIISIAGSFCEELFEGVDPREETEVFYYEKFFEGNEKINVSNITPDDQNVADFIDHLISKFTPAVSIDDNGREILKNDFDQKLNKFSDVISNTNDYLVHANSGKRFAQIQPDSPSSEFAIDFNESFFLSYHLMPSDAGAGFEETYNNNLYPYLTFAHDNNYFQFKHYYTEHDMHGILWIGFGYTYWSIKFVINDSVKNNLKNEPYHIVFQYTDSGGDSVNFKEDFIIYVNNEIVTLTDINNNDLSAIVDKDDLNFFMLSEEVSSNVYTPKSSKKIQFLGEADLALSGVEIYIGQDYEILLASEFENSTYFTDYGTFKIPHNKAEVLAKGADLFFGINDNGELFSLHIFRGYL